MAEINNHEHDAAWEKLWELQNHQARTMGFYDGMKAQREHMAYDMAMYGHRETPKPAAGNGTKAMSILGTIGFGIVAAALLGGN